MQLTHLINERLREATEDAEHEKAFKDVAEVTTKDQKKAVAVTEKKAQASEKALALAENGKVELEMKLEGTELKLANAESLTLA